MCVIFERKSSANENCIRKLINFGFTMFIHLYSPMPFPTEICVKLIPSWPWTINQDILIISISNRKGTHVFVGTYEKLKKWSFKIVKILRKCIENLYPKTFLQSKGNVQSSSLEYWSIYNSFYDFGSCRNKACLSWQRKKLVNSRGCLSKVFKYEITCHKTKMD